MHRLKIYIRVHTKYWIFYVFTIITMSLAFTIGIMLILFFAFTDRDVRIAENVAHIIFGILGSLPLIIPNYKASIEISKSYNSDWHLYFILSQSISIIMYCIFYKIYVLLQ